MACYRWYFTDFSDRFICRCKQYDCPDQLWLHNDSIATDLSHYWFCFVRRIDFCCWFPQAQCSVKKELKQLRKELSDYRSNNEKVLQEQREVLEREYTNKQAELAQDSSSSMIKKPSFHVLRAHPRRQRSMRK